VERLTHIDYVRPFLHEVSGIVGKRWNFRVLWELRNGKKMRYGELLESLSGISPSTLADVLKQLQTEFLIRRTIHGKTPPFKVEYKITANGMDLVVASSSLIKWAMRKNHKGN
jgi:DNA-binding HxlR family transcriptional regulator